MSVSVISNNLPKEKKGAFSRVPHRIGKKGQRVTPSARAIAGRVFGLTDPKKENSACWTSYDQLHEEFGIARPTVAAALSQLKEKELIRKSDRDRSGTALQYIGEAGRTYDIVPLYLYTADITIAEKKRRLTKAQVLILSYMMTQAKRPKNDGKVETSIKRLHKLLALSETTIKKAIRILLKAKLIFRSKEDKGANKYKLTTFHVNRDLYEYEKFRKKKKVKQPTDTRSQATIAADARADRERYYAQRRAEMESRVEKYRLKVYSMAPRIREIEEEIQAMAPKIARAEFDKLPTYPILVEKERRLVEERLTLMKRFNVSEEKLKQSYYSLCKDCQDTGYLPNGKSCTCHLHLRRQDK